MTEGSFYRISSIVMMLISTYLFTFFTFWPNISSIPFYTLEMSRNNDVSTKNFVQAKTHVVSILLVLILCFDTHFWTWEPFWSGAARSLIAFMFITLQDQRGKQNNIKLNKTWTHKLISSLVNITHNCKFVLTCKKAWCFWKEKNNTKYLIMTLQFKSEFKYMHSRVRKGKRFQITMAFMIRSMDSMFILDRPSTISTAM